MTTAKTKTDFDQLCINTIRTLSLDAVQKANSGHPGLPLGMAPAAYVLWTKFLRHNPKNPKWFNRDRFLFRAGHGSMLIYTLAASDGLRSAARRTEKFPPASFKNARTSRKYSDAGRGNHDRTFGTGFCQRRRNGDRAGASGGEI